MSVLSLRLSLMQSCEVWLASAWRLARLITWGRDDDGQRCAWVLIGAEGRCERDLVVSADRLRPVAAPDVPDAADEQEALDDLALERCTCEPPFGRIQALLGSHWVEVYPVPRDSDGSVSRLIYAYCAECNARYPRAWRLKG